MSEEKRRYLREVLDEFDRYFDEFEKTVQDSIRARLSSSPGEQLQFKKPLVSGVALGLTPEGRPSVQFFGDKLKKEQGMTTNGFRTPIYEQMLDEKEGTLRLIVELPGVEKEAIDISAQEDKIVVQTRQPERKYGLEVPLSNEIDPESGNATYNNGLLDAVFQIRHKTNKGYRRVRVV